MYTLREKTDYRLAITTVEILGDGAGALGNTPAMIDVCRLHLKKLTKVQIFESITI